MAPKTTFNEYFGDFVSLIYPKLCPGCAGPLLKGESGICTICRHEIATTDHHQHEDNALAQRFYGRINLEAAMSYLYFTKGGITQRLLHHLKYEGNQELGRLMGSWYGLVLKENSKWHWDLIIPVPLHHVKLKKRGYNQSDCFADGLSRSLQIPWESKVLIRSEATETQTHKSKEARWENVKDRFEVVSKEKIEKKHVLLVDDVITTGSTMEACGNTLLQAGCGKLSVASLAMARLQ